MIALGLFFLVGVLGLALLFYVAKAINRKLVIWLAWTFGGLLLLLGWHPVPSLATKVLVNAWALLVVLLPVWWLLRWAFSGYTAPPSPPDTGADLKPILDEHGRQIFP